MTAGIGDGEFKATPIYHETVNALGSGDRPGDVVSVLADGGILRPAEVVELAQETGLDLAAAATLLAKESGGGRNVWGHDPVNTGGLYTKGAEVTKAAYQAYKFHRSQLGAQGVGPCQLTYPAYQDQADAIGGCWDWRCNVRVGFAILAEGIKTRGLREGFRAYNGSGAIAERYANDAMARYVTWRTRLAGAVTPRPAPEENEMVNLSVTQTLPAGIGQQVPVMVPPYDGKNAVFRLATGWTNAQIKAIYFVRDKGPNLSPAQEQWGGTGPFTLVHDDRPWWPLPEGTTQVSLEYDSEQPLATLITYTPAAGL